jgi:hypothetical protein
MDNIMKAWVLCALFAVVATANAAQFYEWTDEKGVKQYTQYPPPPNIKNVQQKRLGSNVVETSAPGYAMQQAVKSFPVSVYLTADCGDLCASARTHLVKRGVPFTEKDPQKPEEQPIFKKLAGGGNEVPLLVVGELKTVKGYSASEWDSALDQAGYPSAAVPGAKPVAAPPAK